MDADDETLHPDELVTQLTWVRGLARGLVADPEASRDIVQQVCLLALQQAPPGARTGAPLRAWLAAVARSLARRRVRTERRRARREEIAARPEALAATVDTAAHREALRQLIDAVTALQEPYYSAVVARYFEERSVAEIAARSGDTAAAVRQRLVRARRQLRERLESRIAEDPQGALRAALPLAAPASLTGHGLRSILGRLGDSMVRTAGMGGGAKVAAGLVVLLLVGGTWFALHERTPSSTAPSSAPSFESAASAPATPAEAAPVAEARPLSAPPDLVEAPAAEPLVPAQSGPARAKTAPQITDETWSIVVVDPGARPVPGTRLELWTRTRKADIRHRDLEVLSEKTSTTTTDAAGRGSAHFTSADQYLVALKDGVGRSDRLQPPLSPLMRDAQGEAVVVLQPEVVVDGSVLQPDGQPAFGVAVELEIVPDFPTFDGRYITHLMSGSDGRFHGALGAAKTVKLAAIATDGTRVEQTRSVPADHHIEAALRLPGAWWIRGLVLDADGTPSSTAQLHVFHGPALTDPWQIDAADEATRDAAVRVEVDGRFEYRAKALEPHVLMASFAGPPPTDPVLVVLDAAHTEASVELRQPAGGAISGIVRMADGTRAGGAKVSAKIHSPPALLAAPASWSGFGASGVAGSAQSADDGRFEISGLHPKGLYDVLLSPLGSSPWQNPRVLLQAVPPGTANLELVLPEGDVPKPGRIHVVVRVAATGAPAELSTWTIAPEGKVAGAVSGVKKDNGGDLMIERLPVGKLVLGQTYTVAVASHGLSTVDVHGVIAAEPPETVQVELPALGSLAVDVVDAAGAPLPFVEVRAKRSYGGAGFHTPVPRPADSRGHASFADIDAGTYTVTATLEGVESTATIVVPAGAPGSLRLVAQRG